MRSIALLTAILTVGTACAAYAADTAAQAQTLDAQLQQQQQKASKSAPSAPAATVLPAPATTSTPATDAAPAPVATSEPAAHIDSAGNGAIPYLPLEIQTAGDITYLSGGIGDEERDQLKTQEKQYNLRVLLSDKSGAFIGDVKLRILDEKQTPLVSVDDAGPYFYAHLKPGTYFLETSTLSESVILKIKFSLDEKSTLKEHIVYNQ